MKQAGLNSKVSITKDFFQNSLFNFQGPARDIRGYSSAGRAPALQAGGQEFDSPHLHQGTKEDEQLDVSQYCGAAKQQGDFKSLTILSRYAKHNGRIAQVVRAHA